MNESIDREEAEKLLNGWADKIPSSTVHDRVQELLDILFPPEPREYLLCLKLNGVIEVCDCDDPCDSATKVREVLE